MIVLSLMMHNAEKSIPSVRQDHNNTNNSSAGHMEFLWHGILECEQGKKVWSYQAEKVRQMRNSSKFNTCEQRQSKPEQEHLNP